MTGPGLFRRMYRSQSKLLADDLKLESMAGRFHFFGLAGEKIIQIINNSNVILYVTLQDGTSSIGAVDPKRTAVLSIANDTVRTTIRFYDSDREMKDLCSGCLFNNGRVLRVSCTSRPLARKLAVRE